MDQYVLLLKTSFKYRISQCDTQVTSQQEIGYEKCVCGGGGVLGRKGDTGIICIEIAIYIIFFKVFCPTVFKHSCLIHTIVMSICMTVCRSIMTLDANLNESEVNIHVQ